MKTAGVPRHRASRRQRCPGPGPRLRGRDPRRVSQPLLVTATPTPPKPFCAVLPGRPQPRRPGVPSVCFGALRQSASEVWSADSGTPHPLLRGAGRTRVLDSSPVKRLLSVSGGSEACRPGPALRGWRWGPVVPALHFQLPWLGGLGRGVSAPGPGPKPAGGSCFPSAPSCSVTGLGSVSARALARITRKLRRPPRGARLGLRLAAAS